MPTDYFADPVRLPLAPRVNAQSATSLQSGMPSSSGPGEQVPIRPQGDMIRLDGERRLSERQMFEQLTSDDPSERAVAINAFNDRMQLYGDLLTGTRTVALSNASLFPTAKHQGIPSAVFFGDAERQSVDTRWTVMFQIDDRRQQTSPFFRLMDLYHAITVREYQLGEEIEFGSVEASEAIFETNYYGMGLQWNRLWASFQDIWTNGRGMATMQRKWANHQAQLAYDTITASGLSTTSYQDADGSGGQSIRNDIATINEAVTNIQQDIYQQTADESGEQTEEEIGTDFTLLYNSHNRDYKERVRTALTADLALPNANASISIDDDVNITPVGTPRVADGSWYLTLNGRKNVWAQFRDATMYDVEDPRVMGVADGRIGQGAFKPVRGDSQQSRKVATS
jgi:hypothetical protein